MGALLDYRLSDLLLFSPEIYQRLLARYNAEIFPLQLLMLALGAGLFYVLLTCQHDGQHDGRRYGRRYGRGVIAALLAAGWLCSGLLFHLSYYDSINWMAWYLAVMHVVIAGLLLLWGVLSFRARVGRQLVGLSAGWPLTAGLLLLGLAVFVHPLLVFIEGQGLATAAFFGTHPAPTALATLAVMMMLSPRSLSIFGLSFLMLLVSLLTSLALGSPLGWVYGGVLLICLLFLISLVAQALRRRFDARS